MLQRRRCHRVPAPCKLGFEGIVSKRLTAPYRSGPSRDWVKIKNPDSPAMRRQRAGTWWPADRIGPTVAA
jgi:hypothetical protein